MNNREFERVIDEQFARCKDLLCTKQAEYTPDKDVFEVFNKASTLSGVGGRKSALFDFMLKHLVSISDMCHTEEYFTVERWNEKITDAMNYLLLLRAMVAEDEERTKGRPLPDPCGEEDSPEDRVEGDPYDDLYHPDMTCNGGCDNCRWCGCSLPEDNVFGCLGDCSTCSYSKCENPNFKKEETPTTTEGCGTCSCGDYSGISVNPKDCMEDCGDCEWSECTDKSDYLCTMSCSTCEHNVCHKHDEDGSNGGICDLDCNNCGDPCTMDEEQKGCQGECQSCSDDNCPIYWTYHSEVRGKDEASAKDKEEFWSSVSTEEPIPVSERHTKPEGSEESLELFKAYVASLEERSKNS